jgi:RAB protein geranylgeranyltransferase component A
VKVAFKSYDSRVLPEMSAKVLFLTKPIDAASMDAKPILTVSSSAIVTRNGKKVAYVVKDDKTEEVSVTTGRELESLVEITSGLAAGQKVVDKVDDKITDGVKVKVR